ncbi:MAG: hypothetical protein ACLUSX_12280 [Ruminococcus sp.]|uniref:hypothetical protein n=1 Tax=Ruminococcus sp. TaxID=41978 RepID=UPI0039955084
MITFVTQEQWDIVQEVRQHKKRVPKHMDEPNIFWTGVLRGIAAAAGAAQSQHDEKGGVQLQKKNASGSAEIALQ